MKPFGVTHWFFNSLIVWNYLFGINMEKPGPWFEQAETDNCTRVKFEVKIQVLQSNFIETALRHGCSPVNLLHIFRTPFPRNTSGWLLQDLLDTHLDFLDIDIPSKYFVCLQDVLKTASRYIFKTSLRHTFKTSSRQLFKTSSRHVFNMSSRHVFKKSCRRLEDQQMFFGI